jgi:hypothetical protein
VHFPPRCFFAGVQSYLGLWASSTSPRSRLSPSAAGRLQVQRRAGRGQELPFAEDYLKDFDDGVLFTHLLNSIAPEAVAQTPGLLTTMDPSTRIKEVWDLVFAPAQSLHALGGQVGRESRGALVRKAHSFTRPRCVFGWCSQETPVGSIRLSSNL